MEGLQSGAGVPQECLAKDAFDLQKQMDGRWVWACRHSCCLLAERILKNREDQLRNACIVPSLYVESWKNCTGRFTQLVRAFACVGGAQVGRQGTGSGKAASSNTAPTNLGDADYDVGAGFYST